ncbi:Ig-like domain-containing protein [Paenibacillus tuaregi]|uniref:Ig-like domain-containing protein n=1 Tax=Paenibacillus tuaregi TaxID=1816681 RepID=UPI000838F7F2|nr:Ig-like domain-containing protein [Paenibacillus tuaregi]
MYRTLFRKASYALLSLTLASGIAAGHSYASSNAEKPVVEWSRQYGMDERYLAARNVTSTSDGGYLVTGDFSASAGSSYILKLNPAGKMQWEQKIQHDNRKLTTANETIETKDGGFLVTGSTQSESGKHNILLIKLGAQGALEWEKEFDLGFSASSLSLAETKDGSFVITGESYGWPNGQHAFVLKADTQGQEVWLKKLKFSDEQYYADIIAAADGGSIAVGTQYDTYFNDPNKGAVITKLSVDGDEVWTKNLSTPDSLRMASSIAPSGDGGFVIYSKSSRDDHYLTRIDSSGNIKWEKKLDPTPDFDFFKKVVRTEEGYALFSEYSHTSNVQERRYEFLKLDDTGKTLDITDFTVKGFDRMTGLSASQDGGFILLGDVKGPDYNRFMQVTKLAGPNGQPGERTLEGISFADTGKTMAVGEHTAAIIMANYSDGSKEAVIDSVSLTSDNSGIAAVDLEGFITGIKPGSTTIHADFKGHKAQLNVEVFENPNHGDPDHWSYQYGKDQYYILERSIVPASDGGYIVIADTKDQLYSSTKAYILKLNAGGTLEWQQKIQHGLSEYTLPLKAIETKDGGIVVCGITRIQDERARNQVFLAKLSARGLVEWEKGFDGGGNKSGYSVDETTDGGFVVTGGTLSISGEDSAYVLKTDAHGQLMWEKSFRFGSNQNYNDILATPDGGSIAVGTINTYVGSNENDRAIVTKLSPGGEELWTKKFAPIGREAYSIISTKQNNYLIASRTTDGVNYLTELNASGEVIWEESYEASEGQQFYKVSHYGQGYVLLGNLTTGDYPNRESKSTALKLDDHGQVAANLYFTEPNLSGLDVGTVSPDGQFVFIGAVKASKDKTVLQAAKSTGTEHPPGDPVVTGISVANPNAKIVIGEQTTALVKASYSNGAEKVLKNSVVFTSEDGNIATVDSKGVITGIHPGSTTIHADYQGHTAQFQVEVINETEGIFYLDSEEYSLAVGTSLDTTAFLKDRDGKIHNVTKATTFKSKNPVIADYDQGGSINGLRAGITYITAEYQGKTYKALVQVVRDSVPR